MVDSCVLLDILNDDDHWYAWSSNILFEMSKEYNLVINTIIFTEIAFNFDSCEQLEETKATRKHLCPIFILVPTQAI